MHIEKVDDLKPGDIVGRPIWDDMGQILLHSGVKLKPDYIRVLKAKGFTQIYVREPDAVLEVEPEEDLSPVTRSKALRVLREAFESIEGETRNFQKKASIDDIRKLCGSKKMQNMYRDKGTIGKVMNVVGKVLDDVLTRPTLAGLASIKSANGKLYEHSLDVCTVAILIGRSVGMTNIRLMQLATGCLLHDIGMVFVEDGADYNTRLRQHTLLGFELLRNSPDPDIMAPHVALEHHEHQDGTGVPRGLVGSNAVARNRDTDSPVPTLIGEIAAVANIYDNLLSGADGRAALPPDLAIAAICKGTGTLVNKEVVNAFLRVVPVYAKGMDVVVRTPPYQNFIAIVTEVNQTRLDRPCIAIIRTDKGKAVPPLEIDLSEEYEEMKIRSIRL